MQIQITEPAQSRYQNPPAKIAAVDFGTTNSLIAFYDGIECIVGQDEHKQQLMPSVIALDRVQVGHDAICIPNSIHSIKRYITPKGRCKASLAMPLEQYVARIFLKLYEISQKQFQTHTIIITVPAHFDNMARNVVKKAAESAGFVVYRLLHEPTAAALAYQLHETPGVHLIYDFGGGTFDVSLVKSSAHTIRVLATAGDNHLGGDDLDLTLLSMVTKNPPKQLSTDTKLALRAAKESLSLQTAVKLVINKVTTSIKRADFEQAIDKYLKKTHNIIKQVLRAVPAEEQIQNIVLAGGTTKIPIVAQQLQAIFPHAKILNTINPEKAVVMGAARHAYFLSTGQGCLLSDVVPLSLGIETFGGGIEKIIARNTPLPVIEERLFTTSHDGQRKITVSVYQGEATLLSKNHHIATLILDNIHPSPATVPQILISFMIDESGMLTVSAHDQKSGNTSSIEIELASTMDSATVDNMLTDYLNEESNLLILQLKQQITEQIIQLQHLMNSDKSPIAITKTLNEAQQILDQEEVEQLQQLTQRLSTLLINVTMI